MSDLFKTLQTIGAFDNYTRWIFSKINPHLKGDVIDIGSGIGDIAKYYIQNRDVERIWVTDSEQIMLDQLANKFSLNNKFNIQHFDISKNQENASAIKADVITCVNVLEHIQDDLSALINMKSILNVNGKIVLFVPAVPFVYGSLDKLVGHYRRYTKDSLRVLAKNAGLKVIDLHYMNMFGLISWFIAGRIMRYNYFDSNSCRTMDKFVPFLERLERCFIPPIGQSLVLVCSN